MKPLYALLALGLSAGLLTGCTGTQQGAAVVRYISLSGTGQQTVLSAADMGEAVTSTPTPVSVPGAVGVASLGGGQQVAVLYPGRLEVRDASLSVVSSPAFAAPAGITPCYTRLVSSVAHDRLAALSDCGAGALQQVVVWRADGSVSFVATLPPPTPASPTDTRYAVQGDVLWAVHPAAALGNSELLRITRNTDGTPNILGSPITLPLISDLTFYKSQLYAATLGGVRVLGADGSLSLVGGNVLNTRADRLWSDDRLLLGWRNSGVAEPLYVWNGTQALSAGNVSSLQDAAIAPDGTFALLSGSSVQSSNSTTGFDKGQWQTQTLQSLSAAGQAITWTIP